MHGYRTLGPRFPRGEFGVYQGSPGFATGTLLRARRAWATSQSATGSLLTGIGKHEERILAYGCGTATPQT